MRFGKIVIGFMTVILAGLAVVAATQEGSVTEKEIVSPVCSVDVEFGENTETIQFWENEAGSFYVFLPGYVQMDRVFLHLGKTIATINGNPVAENRSCGHLEINTEYPFSYTWNDEIRHTTLTFVQSGGIPSLYMDVQSGNMDYIHQKKGNAEAGKIRLYDQSGSILYSGLVDSVKGRGNASWFADKKPYSLKLSQEANLLDMGKAREWILLADADNPVNIRNKIVYDFAHTFDMAFSPDCEWVDLYLNGEYAGLYLLSERNEVHQERVNLIQGGSFLVSQELEFRLQDQKYPYVRTESGQALRIHYSDRNIEKIQSHWQSAENAILAEDGVDAISGSHWTELIDIDSWARKFLIEEIFANNDGGCISQFFYYNDSPLQSKICAGPVWDYDYAMGGSDVWLKPYTDYLAMNRPQRSDMIYTPWYPALCQNELFIQYVEELFETEAVPLVKMLLLNGLPEYTHLISKAIRTDTLRWDVSVEEAYEDIDYIESFLRARMQFLESVWIDGETYHIVCVNPGRFDLYGYFAVKNGETLPEIVSAEEMGGLGWKIMGTDEPFDVTQPIYEDTQIYMEYPEEPEYPVPKIHYLPFAVLVFGIAILLLHDRNRVRNRGKRDDPVKTR